MPLKWIKWVWPSAMTKVVYEYSGDPASVRDCIDGTAEFLLDEDTRFTWVEHNPDYTSPVPVLPATTK